MKVWNYMYFEQRQFAKKPLQLILRMTKKADYDCGCSIKSNHKYWNPMQIIRYFSHNIVTSNLQNVFALWSKSKHLNSNKVELHILQDVVLHLNKLAMHIIEMHSIYADCPSSPSWKAHRLPAAGFSLE